MNQDLLGGTAEAGQPGGDVAAFDEESLPFGEQELELLLPAGIAIGHRVVPAVEGGHLRDLEAARKVQHIGAGVTEVDVQHLRLMTPQRLTKRPHRPQAPQSGNS